MRVVQARDASSSTPESSAQSWSPVATLRSSVTGSPCARESGPILVRARGADESCVRRIEAAGLGEHVVTKTGAIISGVSAADRLRPQSLFPETVQRDDPWRGGVMITSEDAVAARQLVLSVAEVADLLGISKDLVYDLVARGELPSLRLGRRIVVPRRALLALIGGD